MHEISANSSPRSSTDSVQDVANDTGVVPTPQHDTETPISQATSINNDSQSVENTTGPTVLPSPLPLRESLSTTALLSIIGGHIVILGTFGFLGFLWFGHGPAAEGVQATPLWRRIALEGWMIQTITLCALVLRFIVSLQSVVCTSMIAALVLEKRCVRKSQVAWFSVMRSINDGPRQLIQLLLTSKSSQILLMFELWLLIVVAIATLGLQFTSTILLSDLHDYVVVGDINATWTRSLVSDPESPFMIATDGTWMQRSPVYAVFGEALTNTNATPDDRGYSDTGLIQRGLIPVTTSENRTSIRSYSGNAIVMNSQVSCIRPRTTGVFIESSNGYGYVSGTLNYILSLQDAGLNSSDCGPDDCKDQEFYCTFPTQVEPLIPVDIPSYQSSFCHILGDRNSTLYTSWNPSKSVWAVDPSVWLVFTSNLYVDEITEINPDLGFRFEDPTQEWKGSMLPSGRSINATLCFSGYNLERKSVKMGSSGALREPTVNWSLLLDTYDTTQVRDYIGATGTQQTHLDRSILDLDILGEPDDGDATSYANSMSPFIANDFTEQHMKVSEITLEFFHEILHAAVYVGPNRTYSGCWACFIEGAITNPEFGMLFTDIVATTGRAAVALQSFMSILATTIYEAYINSLEGLQESHISRATVVPTPGPCSEHTCSGFVSVAALLGTHLACVVAITALYVRQVRYSRHANVWHAVSQLVNPELEDIIDRGNAASDKSVIDIVKAEGGDVFVKLVANSGCDKVETVKYISTQKTPLTPKKPGHPRMLEFMNRWIKRNDVRAN